MNKQIPYLFLFGLFVCGWSCQQPRPIAKQPPNILFIAIDDLRPQLNCYGEEYMHTPHLDNLASEGRLFKNHYVQVPTCGASRYSLLMGQYPTYRKYLGNYALRDYLADAKEVGQQTLPQLYKNNGYYTVGLGKIGHFVDGLVYSYEGEGDGQLEMPDSWDEVWGPTDKWGTAWNAFFAYADGSNRNTLKRQVAPIEFTAEKDKDLPDGLIAEKAVATLKELNNKGQPFFLGVGFFKPHLPFVAPKKYWDLYEGKALPLSPNPEQPQKGVAKALHSSGELFNSYKIQPEKGGAGIRISDDYAMQLRRAYFAAVSYADAQVGKVLQTLKETGLDKNTIVVVWGDHGWHLGDQTLWGKHSLFERALNSAFIIKTPKMSKRGKPSESIVESVDIYPTLLELCNLESNQPLSGKSLVPVLEHPDKAIDKVALSFWHTGYSMRTPQYRLSKFKVGDAIETELYDHSIDPNENENLAQNDDYHSIVIALEKQILKEMPTTFWASLK